MCPTHSFLTIPQTTTSTQTSNQVHKVHVVTNLLDPSECATIIHQHTNLTPSNVLRDTIRDREIFDDQALSDLLWSRLKGFLENEKVVDEDGCEWAAEGLNERFRLCRYLPGMYMFCFFSFLLSPSSPSLSSVKKRPANNIKGGKFYPHHDGKRFASVNEQSFMTVNMYLNTVPEEHQGATRFLAPLSSPSIVLAKVQPVLGIAAIFRDNVWHDGEELLGREKYLLRTDLMYRRVVEFDFEKIYGKLDDEGKGMEMLGIAQKLEDSGQSEEAVKWYKKAFKTWPALEKSW